MAERQPHAQPIPLTTLGELEPGWVLDVRCGQCRNRVRLRVDMLATKFGRQTRLSEVARRLRCRNFSSSVGNERCGGRPRMVTLAQLRVRGSFAVAERKVILLDERRQ